MTARPMRPRSALGIWSARLELAASGVGVVVGVVEGWPRAAPPNLRPARRALYDDIVSKARLGVGLDWVRGRLRGMNRSRIDRGATSTTPEMAMGRCVNC